MPLPDSALLIREWAPNGDRTVPEDRTPAIDRANGWTSAFAQPGGPTPAYEVFNQIMNEITALLEYLRDHGALAEWNAAVSYDHPAFVVGSNGTVYQSAQDSLNQDPTSDADGTYWTVFGSVPDGSITFAKLASNFVLTVANLPRIPFTKLTGVAALAQLPSIPTSKLTGQIMSSQIEGGDRSEIINVRPSQVAHNGNEIQLTPNPAVTALAEGQQFRFRLEAATTGLVTIKVNTLSSLNLVRRDGTQVGAAAPHLIDEDVLDIVHYDGTFYLAGLRPGTAAGYDVGIAEGDIPLLGPNGRLLAARLPSTIAANQIGALPASKTTSGRFPADRLPETIPASQIGSLPASKVTSGRFNAARMPSDVRVIHVSTAAPTSSDGSDGDLWFRYAS